MAIQVFPDSPRNGCWGDRPYAIIDLAGPASYTQVVTGSPPTGGQAIGPSNFGLVAPIEGIIPVSLSSDGQYSVEAFQLTNAVTGAGNLTWALIWTIAATGAQVGAGVNLSSVTVRLIAFGPY